MINAISKSQSLNKSLSKPNLTKKLTTSKISSNNSSQRNLFIAVKTDNSILKETVALNKNATDITQQNIDESKDDDDEDFEFMTPNEI